MAELTDEAVLAFLFETGLLRKVKHEGWRLIGVDQPCSVADHCLRGCHIGYLLAIMEQYENPYEVVTMVAFHDIGECRVGDLHKIAARYVQKDETRAVQDQTAPLGPAGRQIFSLWEQTEHRSSKAGVIAKDADLLEQALTAKEYIEIGHAHAQDWIKNVGTRLQTSSAKRLLALLSAVNSNDWWQGLKKIPPN